MTSAYLLFALATALGGGQGPARGASTVNDYDFIAPQGWQVRREGEHLAIQNMSSGCLILVLTPQASSGNLEQDAANVFLTMYQGWQYRGTGRQQFTLSKGRLPKGLEYVMVAAAMSKPSADGTRYDGFEEGVALVIGFGRQIAIVSVRHRSDMMGHDECRKYETWRRFFNSFTVKNAAAPNIVDDAAGRIVGVWTASEAGAVGEYVFAANGNYAQGGALGSTSTVTNGDHSQIHLTTYNFQGDGSYALNGNRLTMRRRGAQSDQATIRFAQVNHGSTGWTDQLCMLKVAADNGKEYEVCLERRR
jgi:hypothetical protein